MKLTYYAQFDGDEIDGKVLKLGDPVDETVDAGTIVFLVNAGRISTSKPATTFSIPAQVLDKPVGDMTRDELVGAILASGVEQMRKHSLDDLRTAVERSRETPTGAQPEAEAGSTPSPTPAPTPPAPPPPPPPAETTLAAMLDGNVEDVTPRIAAVTDPAQLGELATLEAAGKKRTTVAKAIDERIAALKTS